MKKQLPGLEIILEAAERQDGTGFCIKCGAETSGVEPDARRYKCDECGEKSVYGAEEIVMAGLASLVMKPAEEKV